MAGHAVRINPQDPVERLFLHSPDGKMKVGRPNLRWRDEMRQDAKRTGIHKWRMVLLDRNRWRGLLRQARTHPGL